MPTFLVCLVGALLHDMEEGHLLVETGIADEIVVEEIMAEIGAEIVDFLLREVGRGTDLVQGL